ncbi:MAG: hypothetical protein KQH53_16070 [Desulfarculaceae bacterium]|nr:hypothetical protein [Desulfarculaceae bacterium]
MTQAIHVVVNLSSGPTPERELAQEVSQALEAAGLEARLWAEPSDQIAEAMQRAAGQASELLVVGGGDGTISHAAGLAHERGLALGVLPTGTLNHFAKDLGLPLELDEAVEVIARGRRRRVDLARVNDRVFINNLSLGLYPRAVREREKASWLSWTGQFVSTGWALAKVLTHSPREEVVLEADGERQDIRSHLIFVGNNRYLDGQGNPASRAALDQGGLDIFWSPASGPWALLKAAFYDARGRYPLPEAAQCWASSARLESRKPSLQAVCDGEVLRFKPPLELASLPGALEVLVP